jgi:hypothetical protein
VGATGAGIVTRSSDSADWPRITGDDGVRGQHRYGLEHGLRDQDAVERVFVNRRQCADGDGVIAGDGQFAVPILK